jgi:hypothetical protein
MTLELKNLEKDAS